jgi:primosomal protein N' (replication factor Y)
MNSSLVDVALPVPLPTLFTYEVPPELAASAQPGARVLVPFRNKSLAGVIVRRAENAAPGTKLRRITRVLDSVPALTPKLIELGNWIATYYLAPPGEVFRGMLPPLTELKTVTEATLTKRGEDLLAGSGEELDRFTDEERALLDRLAGQKPLRISSSTKRSATAAALQRLRQRGFVELREHLTGRQPRVQRILAWNANGPAPCNEREERIRAILENERGPVPLPVLLKLAQASRSSIERMIRAGQLRRWEEPVDPAEDLLDAGYTPPAHVLNEEQERAFAQVRARFELGEFGVLLLHGVTGSGKTEVYLRAIQEVLARGKTAIVLVPEIALTLWIGRQCRAWFGARFEGVAVLHSALGDAERAREWWRVRNGEARVVVGTRSAIFAPVENLGLVIVDEEQESSYKQEETPRYHGRDAAIVRAKIENAAILLGSATPSLETYHNTRSGKYELLTIASRVAGRSLADVEIVDLRAEFQHTHQTSPISSALRQGIADCLTRGTQAMLLINRRGYSWSVLCRSCGASVQCANCSISMTYHKQRNRIECHYCGAIQPVPGQCPKCQSRYIYFFGEGSEQLEERLRAEFPGARIARLDRDTTRTKRQFQETLGAFAAGALDILVGTQMLAKGHDFHRVTLAGVVGADSSLTLPDFRAAERTFQLLTQVAGRAGRGELPGRVLIQTFYPEHYAIQDAVKQDYPSFFERELHFRRLMAYPPFTALANLIVRHASLEKAIHWSRQLSEYFAPHDGNSMRVLGPAAAPLSRLKREHRFQFLLKSQRRSLLTKILSGALAFCDAREIPQTALAADVDPLSLL